MTMIPDERQGSVFRVDHGTQGVNLFSNRPKSHGIVSCPLVRCQSQRHSLEGRDHVIAKIDVGAERSVASVQEDDRHGTRVVSLVRHVPTWNASSGLARA